MRIAAMLLVMFGWLGVERPPTRFAALLIALPPDVLRVEDKNRFTHDSSASRYSLTTITDGVLFDVDGNGVQERVAWTARDSDTAFVVLDRNKNGQIDDGTEIIGDRSVPGKDQVVDALRSLNLATNGGVETGSIDEDDPLYTQLLLWYDRDHNGTSARSELRHAADVFTKIGLGYGQFGKPDEHGNLFRYWSWVELRTAPGKGNNAIDRAGHVSRLRFSFDVLLGVEPASK